jgi:hypothetical protein
MPCPFYGQHAAVAAHTLIASGGNQCALITREYAPCQMETAGKPPDLEYCEWNLSARAIDFAKFERKMFAAQAKLPVNYPD